MLCPKCNNEIDDNAKVCPYCKKVLQLLCPNCQTLNKNHICSKCGYTILSKCKKCGKINPTQIGKCSKCGMDTQLSISLSESEIPNFTCAIIEFPNINTIKNIVKTKKAFAKFKENLYKLIVETSNNHHLKWQVIDNTFIIKFNKEASFEASATKSVLFILELIKPIMKLNVKLKKAHDTLLRCTFSLVKKDINTKFHEFKTGINIKMMKDASKNITSALQVLIDDNVGKVIKNKYSISQIGTLLVKDRLEVYHELNIEKYVSIPEIEDKKEEEKDLTQEIKEKLKQISNSNIEQVSEVENNDKYYNNINKIDFQEQVNKFLMVESGELEQTILSLLGKQAKNIISVKTRKKYYPLTENISFIAQSNNLCTKAITICCTDITMNRPFGFFYELFSTIFNYTISSQNFGQNQFAHLEQLDKAGVIESLINFQPIPNANPELISETLKHIFKAIFKEFDNYLIYIENFEKIDETSFEIFKQIIKDFNNYNLHFVLFANEEYSLHKDFHFLLSNPYYTEITVTKTSFEKILEPYIPFYKNMLDSFYMEKIAQYTNGSLLYLAHATEYLKENGIIEIQNDTYNIVKQSSVILPTSVERLIETRFKLLMKNQEVYSVFVILLFLGPRVDISTLGVLCLKNIIDNITILCEKGYIYLDNEVIYFNNYELLKSVIDDLLENSHKINLANFLLSNLVNDNVPLPINLTVYQLLNNQEKISIYWKNLANISLLLGDFNYYLICNNHLLSLLDNNSEQEDVQNFKNEYKTVIYKNLTQLSNKFILNNLNMFVKTNLEDIEPLIDSDLIIKMNNKLLQNSIKKGYYSQALIYANRIISKLPKKSFKPYDFNFDNILFWVYLLKINIFFNTGNFHECISLGNEFIPLFKKDILSLLVSENMNEEQIHSLIFNAIGYISMAKILQNENVEDFINIINTQMENLPNSFILFIYLQKYIHREDFNINIDIETLDNTNILGQFIIHIIQAFDFIKIDATAFAQKIYQAKLISKEQNFTNLELICDLLIGYSYQKLGEIDKAYKIYQDVKEISTKKGLTNNKLLTWFFIANLKIEQNHIDIGLSIAKNTMSSLDKNPDSNVLLQIMFNLLISKLLLLKKDYEQSNLYKNQAIFIINKNKLNNNPLIIEELNSTNKEPENFEEIENIENIDYQENISMEEQNLETIEQQESYIQEEENFSVETSVQEENYQEIPENIEDVQDNFEEEVNQNLEE